MDELNINKYLGQINPILIVPVLSAVVGAILVFVFGFKRPNEPRFQSSSADSLKKSKRKANAAKNETTANRQQQNAASAKLANGKKAVAAVAAPATGERSSATNNNSAINNNNNNYANIKKKDDKKAEEKKSDVGSPAKKPANAAATAAKKSAKEAASNGKKSVKNAKKVELGEKPADFDDGNWFTVQSKSAKQKSKVDETVKVESASPKSSPPTQQAAKVSNKSKSAKVDDKSADATPVAAVASETVSVEAVEAPATADVCRLPVTSAVNESADTAVAEAVVPIVEVQVETTEVAEVAEVKEPEATPKETKPAKKKAEPVAKATAADEQQSEYERLAFDELGEWTDAKPDRKKGNKKKSRKD